MVRGMVDAPQNLPEATDPSGLDGVRKYLASLQAEGRHEEVLDQVMQLLLKVLADNTGKSHRIAALLKQLYGRKSERMSSAQLDLFLHALADDADAAPATESETVAAPEPEAHEPVPAPARPAQRRPGRNPLPEHLPRIRDERKVPPELRPCPRCGRERTCIGHEISEVLDFVPGHFMVLEIDREKLACKPCQEGVIIAEPAQKLGDGGMCGPGLMAQVLTGKYQDHTPLYRMHGIFLRSGVDLSESTLGSWVTAGAALLLPLATLIWKRAKASPVIGADDTGVRVLDQDHENGVKRGHLWIYLGYGDDGKARWPAIRFTPDWSKQGPADFLAGFSGTLQGDGYKGWMSLATQELAGIVLAGCMAHARRKLVEALEAGSLTCAAAVKIIQKLYLIEARARDQGLDPAARLALRQAESVPLMADLKTWRDQHKGRPPKSPLAKAVTYLENQWEPLEVFLADGRVQIDNNLVENQARPAALGRKNWLFAGSDAGAERAAIVYTVLATCRLADAEPWEYLRDVLPELARRGADAEVEDLLPYEWVTRRRAAALDAQPR